MPSLHSISSPSAQDGLFLYHEQIDSLLPPHYARPRSIMSSNKNIIIACGGTGGHLFPGIAVAQELKKRGHHPILLISQKNVDKDASKKYGELDFISIPAIAKPKTFSLKMIPFLWKLQQAIRQCRSLLLDKKCDAVIGMGGFTSMPPIIAAKRLGLKTFIHDSNALPGKSNRMTSRWCSKVFIGMAAAAKFFPNNEVIVTGTPVRDEINHLPSREDAARKFSLDPTRPIISVVGGSQGAVKLNDLVKNAYAHFPQGVQVLHIAGAGDLARLESANSENYRVIGFCDDMPAVFAASDIMICRSGASTLTEIARVGTPSILIPFPFAADDHQTKNAEVFSQAGAGILVQEKDTTAEQLAKIVAASLVTESLQKMRQNTLSLDVSNPAQQICQAMGM